MKKLIYLVEDNEEISEMIEYLLTDLDFQVKAIANIKSFKESMERSYPDLIILDIMLPDGNGIETCQVLKSNPITKSIPVIMMSAHVNIESKAYSAGADGFIGKPFDIDKFMEKVKQTIDI